MEIRRSENGDIHFFGDNGDIYEVIYKDEIDPIQKEDIRPFHPMCRCSIIIEPEDEFFTYCTGWFIWRYKEECKQSPIWRN